MLLDRHAVGMHVLEYPGVFEKEPRFVRITRFT